MAKPLQMRFRLARATCYHLMFGVLGHVATGFQPSLGIPANIVRAASLLNCIA